MALLCSCRQSLVVSEEGDPELYIAPTSPSKTSNQLPVCRQGNRGPARRKPEVEPPEFVAKGPASSPTSESPPIKGPFCSCSQPHPDPPEPSLPLLAQQGKRGKEPDKRTTGGRWRCLSRLSKVFRTLREDTELLSASVAPSANLRLL